MMQNIVIYGKGVTRNLLNNVINDFSGQQLNLNNRNSLSSRIVSQLFLNLRLLSQTFQHPNRKLTTTSNINVNTKQQLQLANLHLVTAYSGFSKDLSKPLCRKGVIGDDAWFISTTKCVDVLGVADGVGGWREYGIDPSKFSSSLMETCKRLIEKDKLDLNDNKNINPQTPIKILSHSYNTLLENKNGLIGSSTACIVVFHHESQYIHTANLGDSGFVIVRENKVVHRSQEQQHYFNSPFQLAIHPHLNDGDSMISDMPESASMSSFKVIEGDFIIVATDGLWDNMPDSFFITEISKIKSYMIEDLEKAAHAIAKKAIDLAFDPDYISPFAVSAKKNIGINIRGGKPDDVTVLLARVSK